MKCDCNLKVQLKLLTACKTGLLYRRKLISASSNILVAGLKLKMFRNAPESHPNTAVYRIIFCCNLYTLLFKN